MLFLCNPTFIKKRPKTRWFFYSSQSWEEGCAWGDPNGGGFGTGGWVGLGNSGVTQGPVSVSKYLSVPPVTVTEARLAGARVCSSKLGSWRIPLPWIWPLDHLHWPSVLENLSEETSWLQNSQLSPNTGVLSQLKMTTDSRRDMIGVSWMNWVHKYTPPPPNACHFPNTLCPTSSSELSFVVQGKSRPTLFILSIFLNMIFL